MVVLCPSVRPSVPPMMLSRKCRYPGLLHSLFPLLASRSSTGLQRRRAEGNCLRALRVLLPAWKPAEQSAY